MTLRPETVLLFLFHACCLWAAQSAPAVAVQVTTIAYGPNEVQILDLYTPDILPDELMSTVVLAHGGLWEGGGRGALATLCNNLVSQSNGAIACASIDYRLSGELGGVCTGTGKDTYIDQVRDMGLAYSVLQSNAESHGLDPRRMHVGGHSAGAHLAHTINLRWSEFAQPCSNPGGCPAALSAIGLEGIYDIPAWNNYDISRWGSRFECSTRKAFGAPGPSPEACLDGVLDQRCWDAGSPIYLANNAEDLGIKPAGDALLIHSSGDDWVDIAEATNFGGVLETAFPDIDVVTKAGGSCATGQHNAALDEASLAACVIEFVSERVPPATTLRLLTPGLNDAWYNPATDGQGFFITVFPELGHVSLAWFTYDTELPSGNAGATLGDPGHRWLTALGPIDGNQVTMDITLSTGGIFDTPTEIERTDPPGSDGTIKLTFDSCNSGTVEYDIPSIERQGIIPIQRVANDNVALCEALKTE